MHMGHRSQRRSLHPSVQFDSIIQSTGSSGHLRVRDPDGGLVIGGSETVARPWDVDGIPEDFSVSLHFSLRKARVLGWGSSFFARSVGWAGR